MDGGDDSARVLPISCLLSHSYQASAGLCYTTKKMLFASKDY
jgi:hypothetical protein